MLLFCLLAGFALRFYRFDQKSLWLDEIYTLEDSRDDLSGQIKFYKEHITYFQAPLFFTITHQFYPFTKPERGLRVIPLIFGTLSIPMIYLLGRQFSPSIALPCTLALTFMTYHIGLSQDGRCYTLLLFFGITSLYFFMRHINTSKRVYLIPVAVCFSILFYTNYSSIPFILSSQLLWFYSPSPEARKTSLSSFVILNGITILLCLPWLLFLAFNYTSHAWKSLIEEILEEKTMISFPAIAYGILNDWAPHTPGACFGPPACSLSNCREFPEKQLHPFIDPLIPHSVGLSFYQVIKLLSFLDLQIFHQSLPAFFDYSLPFG